MSAQMSWLGYPSMSTACPLFRCAADHCPAAIVLVCHACLLLVAMPGAPSSFLFLVVRPGAPCSVLLKRASSQLLFAQDLQSDFLFPCWRGISQEPGSVRNGGGDSSCVGSAIAHGPRLKIKL